MSGHSAEFKEWLSGQGFYRNPPHWACRVSGAQVRVVPNFRAPIAVLLALMTFFIGFAVIMLWNQRGTGGAVFLVGFTVLACALTVFLLAAFLSDQIKGPYLVYSISDGTIRLPRAGLVIKKADVSGFRVVSGNWVGGEHCQQRQDDAISELHLIARTTGGPTAFLVVGWYWGDSMTPVLNELTRATGLPLEIVQQGGVETSVPSIPEWPDR